MEKLNAVNEVYAPKITETLKVRLETRLEQLNELDIRISNSLIKLSGFMPESAKTDSSAMQEAGVLGEIYNLLASIGDVIYRLDRSADILETIV